MSGPFRRAIVICGGLFAASVLQSAFSASLAWHGARPNLISTTAFVSALFCDANGAAAVGFVAGWIDASLAAPPHGGFGSIITSRTLACLAIGLAGDRLFRDHARVAVILTALGTAASESLVFLFAPQPGVIRWVRTTAGETLYNALLAVPVYLVLRGLAGVRRAGYAKRH